MNAGATAIVEQTTSSQASSKPVVTKFIGSFERNIDNKLRIGLPHQFRDKLLDHSLIMVRWLKRSLAIFPEVNWEPLAEAISKLDLYDDFGLTVRHQFFGNAREVKMDKREGRIVIPPDMADYARLKGPVMILGDWDKVTIWNYTYYQDQLAVDDVTFSEKFPKVIKLAKGQESLESLKAEHFQGKSNGTNEQ